MLPEQKNKNTQAFLSMKIEGLSKIRSLGHNFHGVH